MTLPQVDRQHLTLSLQSTDSLATRAREQSDAMQRQFEQHYRGASYEEKGLHHPAERFPASTHNPQAAWEYHNNTMLPATTYPDFDRRVTYPYGHESTVMQSPQSAVTSSSGSSNQSSSVPTIVSSHGHHPGFNGASSRRTSKYHDGLLIRESKMPPSSTNPLLCLSEAALGKRCIESDSEEESADGFDDASEGRVQSSHEAKRTGLDEPMHGVEDTGDAQTKSARDIAVMLENSGWTHSFLAHAACERASYFSGASASASWDTRRCDPIDRGIVTPDEVDRLFGIFMSTVQEQFCLLDPVVHNVQSIKQSSNFLFSVILAIASSVDRSTRSTQQFEQLRSLVDSLIVEVLSRNIKSVEVVKGLIVWPMWAHLTPLMAEDRAWLLIGTAARMAKELDLSMREDVPLADEIAQRLARDRSRTWALAAIMERSFSSFSGQRPNTTLDVDWGSLNDWLKSPISLDGDTQVVAFLHLRRIEEIMRSRIFGQSYYEVGSIESIRVSANVLFEAWLEAWCEHPALTRHSLTSTIMRIIGLHIQVLINTHAIRESDRRKAICEASNMRVLRICTNAAKSARDQCVALLTDACQLAIDNLSSHAHSLSRIVSAMLGWSGVHLLKNGPIETRGLVVQLGLMLAGDPHDPTHSRSFARFYGRFILSLSAELVDRDRTEQSRRKRQRVRESSHASNISPADRATASPLSEGRVMSTSATEHSGVRSDMKDSVAANSMSDMALAFESAASSAAKAPASAGRLLFPVTSSQADSSATSAQYAAIGAVPTMFAGPTAAPQSYRNAPASSIGPSSASNAAFDAVTNTWLGTDDLLDQYMQSILPIFNDFEQNSTTHASAGTGSGGGVGVAMPGHAL